LDVIRILYKAGAYIKYSTPFTRTAHNQQHNKW